jgi:hypothetical protein
MAIDQLKNPQALIYAAVVVLFTYTADQLVLRYLMKMRKRG